MNDTIDGVSMTHLHAAAVRLGEQFTGVFSTETIDRSRLV